MNRTFLTMAAVLAVAAFTAPARAEDMLPPRPADWAPPPPESVPNHRQVWRDVIGELARYGKARRSDFVVLVHGGADLVVKGQREADWDEVRDPQGRNFEKRMPLGQAYRGYVNAVDGMVVDGLYCGGDAYGKPLADAIAAQRKDDETLAQERARGVRRNPAAGSMGPFSLDPQEELRRAAAIRREGQRQDRMRRRLYALDTMRAAGRRVVSIEACKTPADADSAYRAAVRDQVATFVTVGASKMTGVPTGHPWGENSAEVTSVNRVRNWLPLIRPNGYGSKDEWLRAVAATNYDMLLVDVAYRGVDGLTPADVRRLQYKETGARRLVLAVLPLGRAYDWRWYWQKGWHVGDPAFLFAPDANDPGAYVTMMDNPQWKELLGKTLVGVVDSGFDGVVLDDVDTYLWFEELMPLQ